jgi:hypothetical protein
MFRDVIISAGVRALLQEHILRADPAEDKYSQYAVARYPGTRVRDVNDWKRVLIHYQLFRRSRERYGHDLATEIFETLNTGMEGFGGGITYIEPLTSFVSIGFPDHVQNYKDFTI